MYIILVLIYYISISLRCLLMFFFELVINIKNLREIWKFFYINFLYL